MSTISNSVAGSLAEQALRRRLLQGVSRSINAFKKRGREICGVRRLHHTATLRPSTR